MAKIEAVLEKKRLIIQNQDILSSGDINVDQCIFTFDDVWAGYTKTGVFYQDKDHVQYAILGSDGSCLIPAAAMAREGNLYIGVFGVDGPKVITSTVERVYIRQGAISGDTVTTEPSDDIFLAIIAQYQRIAGMMQKYEETAQEFNLKMAEQTEVLKALNAFDVADIKKRLDAIEDRMADFEDMVEGIRNREIVLRNIPVKFIEKTCRIENEAFTEDSLCDIYFDEYSYEIAAGALILPVSHEGYLELTSSVDVGEELTANILIRRD